MKKLCSLKRLVLILKGMFIFSLVFICSCGLFEKNKTVVDINGYKLNAEQLSSVLKTVSSSFDEEVARLKNNSISLKRWIVDQLINEQILIEEAKRRNVELTDAEIDKSLKDTDLGLQTQNVENPIDSFAADRIKRRLLSQKIIDILLKENVVVSDEEINDYYKNNLSRFSLPDQCRFRQIMVAEKEKALEARAKITEGLDFISAVEEYDESVYKEKGGDTGYIDRQLLPSFLGKACDSLSLNEISDVLESPYGYCIVSLIGKRDANVLSLDSSRESILNDIRQVNGQDFLNSWLEKKRKSVIVVVNWEAIGEIKY